MRDTIFLVAILTIPACGGASSLATTPLDAAAVDPDAPAGDTGAPGGSDAKASGCDLAAKLCTKLAACAPFLLKAVYGDVTTCSDRLTLACTEQSRSTGSGMTANNLQHCADALDTAACKDVFANNVPACTFHGTLPDDRKSTRLNSSHRC